MRTTVFALIATLFAVAAAAADIAIPNRLPEAKAGEWVLMVDTSDAGAGEKVKFTAVEIRPGDPAVVILKREHFNAKGEVDDTKDMEVRLDEHAKRMADLQEKAKQIGQESLWVKDKELKVLAVNWDDEAKDGGEKREFKMWLSQEIPLGGVAKFWCSDPAVPSAEVVDFGF